MKQLVDLISQIIDERILRILRILHQVERDGMCPYSHDRHMYDLEVYDIQYADEVIKDFQEDRENALEAFRETGDIEWKEVAEDARILIEQLQEIKDTAYLFVMDIEGNLVKVIDSPEKCLEFFGEEGKG